MRRLGVFSGKVYEENVDVSSITECCYLFESDVEHQQVQNMRSALRCLSCNGCPMAQNKENFYDMYSKEV